MQDKHDTHFVTTKIVLFSHDKKQVLVTHIRPGKEGEGYGLPGGHVDGNETPEEALRRELQEEIGVTIHNFEQVEVFRHNTGKIVIGFTAVAPRDIVVNSSNPDDETGEWKTKEEFMKLDTGVYRRFVLKLWQEDEVQQRHFLAVFFLSFMFGMFGVDRFYLGKIWTGILKLITFGGFGIWVIADLALIMSGSMRDKDGNEMREFKRYKKFAVRTVVWFSVILGLVMLIIGVVIIAALYYVVNTVLSGGPEGMTNLLPPGFAPPDISGY